MAVLGLRFCARAFSSCGKRGPLFIAVRGPLTIAASLVAEHRLQMRRLSSCGSRAQLLRGMWDLPRPGHEPVSPALAGRFSTTAPPGKPPCVHFLCCMTNYYELSNLNQHLFVISEFLWVKGLGKAWLSLPLESHPAAAQVLARATVPSEMQMGKDPLLSPLRLLFVGRIHLLEVVGLRSAFLRAISCTPLLAS